MATWRSENFMLTMTGREILSKIQNMRKEFGLEVEDRIDVQYVCDDEIAAVFNQFDNEIKLIVLANSLTKGENGEFSRDVDINGHNVKITLKKV